MRAESPSLRGNDRLGAVNPVEGNVEAVLTYISY
jgi:hypothetical protein